MDEGTCPKGISPLPALQWGGREQERTPYLTASPSGFLVLHSIGQTKQEAIRQEQVCGAICRDQSPRTQVSRKEQSMSQWIWKKTNFPILLSTEYAPTLFLNPCMLGVNIQMEPSPLYLKKVHDFELVKQPTKQCSKGYFLGKPMASALGSMWKVWAGCKAQQLCSKLLMVKPLLLYWSL